MARKGSRNQVELPTRLCGPPLTSLLIGWRLRAAMDSSEELSVEEDLERLIGTLERLERRESHTKSAELTAPAVLAFVDKGTDGDDAGPSLLNGWLRWRATLFSRRQLACSLRRAVVWATIELCGALHQWRRQVHACRVVQLGQYLGARAACRHWRRALPLARKRRVTLVTADTHAALRAMRAYTRALAQLRAAAAAHAAHDSNHLRACTVSRVSTLGLAARAWRQRASLLQMRSLASHVAFMRRGCRAMRSWSYRAKQMADARGLIARGGAAHSARALRHWAAVAAPMAAEREHRRIASKLSTSIRRRQ